jgi:hypothetical protein
MTIHMILTRHLVDVRKNPVPTGLMTKRKILAPAGNRTTVLQPVASRCIN